MTLDVTWPKDDLADGRLRVLEMVATGAPLDGVLGTLIRLIETQEEGLTCGMLIVAEDGLSFRGGSGPNMPDGYHQALEGVPITPPFLGPCDQAVHDDRVVLVPDIATDTRWAAQWRDLVLSCGFGACRSTPVRASDGQVLASFAMYYDRPRDPDPKDPRTIEIATHLAAIALERARSDEKLRFEERRSRELLEALPVAVYTTDAEGRIAFYNRAAAELWGQEPKLGTSQWCGSLRLYHPDGRPMPLEECPMAVALRTGTALRGAEIVAERPDGARAPVLAYPTPLHGPSGSLGGAVNTLVDVTALRESEDRLAKELAATQQLQEISSILIRQEGIDALHGRLLDGAIALMGADAGSIQMLDREHRRLRLLAWRGFDPKSAAYWEWVGIGAGTTCGVALETERRVVVPDIVACDFGAGTPDREQYVRSEIRAVQTTPLVSRSGRLIGMISTHWRHPHEPAERDLRLLDILARQAADLIERTQAQAALAQSEASLRHIFDSAREYAIITLDGNGLITDWNSGAERLLGYERSEILGQAGALFFTPEDRDAGVPEREMRTARDHGRATNERWHVRKDGSRFWGSGALLTLGGGGGFLCIFRDRTEERRAEKRQKVMINELNHRVKNTLATVQAIASQTFRGDAIPREPRESFEARLGTLARGHDLLTQGLWERTDLRQVVATALDPFHAADEGRLRIDGPAFLVAPKIALALTMALHELATNATKHGALSNEHGQVSVRWSVDEGILRFSWRESGGPSVGQPTRTGFGTRLIQRSLAGELGGEVRVEYAAKGLVCTVEAPVRTLRGADPSPHP